MQVNEPVLQLLTVYVDYFYLCTAAREDALHEIKIRIGLVIYMVHRRLCSGFSSVVASVFSVAIMQSLSGHYSFQQSIWRAVC